MKNQALMHCLVDQAFQPSKSFQVRVPVTNPVFTPVQAIHRLPLQIQVVPALIPVPHHLLLEKVIREEAADIRFHLRPLQL